MNCRRRNGNRPYGKMGLETLTSISMASRATDFPKRSAPILSRRTPKRSTQFSGFSSNKPGWGSPSTLPTKASAVSPTLARTSFPSQLAVASAWDRSLVDEIGRITGREARALGYTNVYTPILDLARDPRWGRTEETYSEDPYLTSELGKHMVRALQSQRVVSTPKHFAVYSVPKGGRDGSSRTDPEVTPRELEMIYLQPFKAAFQDAGALGTMSSYNDYDGVPITASSYFLTEILRGRWGFKGYVVSDCSAVEFVETKHKVAE